jgi:hypothetical protein
VRSFREGGSIDARKSFAGIGAKHSRHKKTAFEAVPVSEKNNS